MICGVHLPPGPKPEDVAARATALAAVGKALSADPVFAVGVAGGGPGGVVLSRGAPAVVAFGGTNMRNKEVSAVPAAI